MGEHVTIKNGKDLSEDQLSYTLECEPEDWEAVKLEQYISREKDPELKAALEDLDEFLFC